MDKSPAIVAKEICFGYGSQKVIDELSLVLEEGDFMGLLGPNGGGKTTLIKLILGILKPTCGEIKLFGKPQSQFRDWHLIGYVPQNATNFDRQFPVTVSEVVAMGRAGNGGIVAGRKDERRIIDEALEKVGIRDLAQRRIGQLSGGQQQRAFIARALANQPRLLILDEPTAGVDVESIERFYDLLNSLNREGITILLVSHDIGTLTKNANRIACIAGSLFYHCPSKELTDERLKELFGSQQILHHHHDA
jgi:zinc transport system ATP-binding protein